MHFLVSRFECSICQQKGNIFSRYPFPEAVFFWDKMLYRSIKYTCYALCSICIKFLIWENHRHNNSNTLEVCVIESSVQFLLLSYHLAAMCLVYNALYVLWQQTHIMCKYSTLPNFFQGQFPLLSIISVCALHSLPDVYFKRGFCTNILCACFFDLFYIPNQS